MIYDYETMYCPRCRAKARNDGATRGATIDTGFRIAEATCDKCGTNIKITYTTARAIVAAGGSVK